MTQVCILTSAHSPYDDRIFYREAVSLKKRGFDVCIIAPFDRSETTIEGIQIHNLPKSTNRTQRFIKIGLLVYQAAIRQNADLYHFHDPDLIPWMWLLAGRGKRVIYDVHEYTGISMLTKEWLPQYLRKPFSLWIDWIEKLLSKRFAGIVTVNNHMEGLFKRNNNKVCTLLNYPLPWLIEKSFAPEMVIRNRVAYIGGSSKERGYEIIPEAMKLVFQKHPEAVCEIIGPIDYSGISKKIPVFTKPGETKGNVTWKGSIPFLDVPGCLARANICWLPFQHSAHSELGTPVKLFEYMAAGHPIVASRLNFIAKVIEEENCGLLVAPEDIKAHADAICFLLENPQIGDQMGARGRQAILEKYNWESQEKTLFEFYESILGNKTSQER